jgi:tetratricopeptide (TPR) repeat protein
MKRATVLIALIFSAAFIKAETAELLELVHSAKSKGKPILLKVFNSDPPFDSVSFADRFIEASFHVSSSSGMAIVNEYRVEAYPSIILLNSSGYLILPVKKVGSLAEIEEYAEKALKMKHETKPLAQFDLEYRNNKMNKTSLYEYIDRRTSSELDNSELIDKYTQMTTSGDLLDRKTLTLFIDRNNFNVPGAFCSFVEQNQEEIKQILKLGDERFNRLAEKSVEYSFRKICANRDESAVKHIIDIKANTFNAGDREILHNEYMTRYFHLTYQPLKLAGHVREYVNAVLKYRERQEEEFSERNKRLFAPSPSLKNSAVRTVCASKLRDAAQYVVEIMSAKSMLNDALSWSVKAEQFADGDKCEIYETQAYILYKLGKRDEALERIEKAYNSIPQDNIEQKKSIGLNLVRMKRGEKIY